MSQQRSLSYDATRGYLRVTQGNKDSRYWLGIKAGDSFTLRKWMTPDSDTPGELYEIDLSRKTCTCKGNKYHGHCKHVDALSKLVELQLLEVVA